ncbi:MAG: methyltransferase domain-containing protein, partial [Actinobacteria bacterium]|nr:methyltransferase domain-containing protein [Actinomycetota bacterium]
YDLVAETYERVTAPLTTEPARDLVALAGPGPGGRVLDVGTGTGVAAVAAQEAVGPEGVAVGVDSSPAMVLAGRRSRPGLRLAVAEAIDLPFRDGTFDAVTANFVLSHFTKYETALFDMIRVLRPGGRLAASAWAETPDEFLRAWRELVRVVVGPHLLADALRRAMPWEDRFSSGERMAETLRDVGLRSVRVETRRYRFEIARDDYVAGKETAATGRFVREMLGEARWEEFRTRARTVFAERFPDPLVDFREVILAVGTKPA